MKETTSCSKNSVSNKRRESVIIQMCEFLVTAFDGSEY